MCLPHPVCNGLMEVAFSTIRQQIVPGYAFFWKEQPSARTWLPPSRQQSSCRRQNQHRLFASGPGYRLRSRHAKFFRCVFSEVSWEGTCSARRLSLVGWISVEHLILRDQALRAFSKEYLVAELDGRAHLAALDQVGVGLKNGIYLFAVGYLFAVERAPTRLIDHMIPQRAKVLDLLAELPPRPIRQYR
jgi:hypothetical protein